jgi:uncharacterized membrane protein
MTILRGAGNFLSFGYLDRREAKNKVRDADWRKAEVHEELECAKKSTQKSIEDLGILKESVYQQSISRFVSLYAVIGKVDLKPLQNNSEIDFNHFKTNFNEMKVIAVSFQQISKTIAGGALVGTTAAFGAMGTAALIGTATTGTAIGTLSGVAATNATLAWLGGGALSAGGAGMTGGMVVLGGIALAPILIFGMFLGSNHGKQILNNAENYSDQMDVLIERIVTLIEELSQIRRGCYLMSECIQGLDALMQIYNIEMDKISYRLEQRSKLSKFLIDPMKNKIFNISILTNQEAEIFVTSANIASMLSEIIRMPLMNEAGAFISGSLEELLNIQPQIQSMSQHISCKQG